jgi:hypothetical protein
MRKTCDLCSEETDIKKGYILSTSQIVYDPGYWKRSFELFTPIAELAEAHLPSVIRQRSGSESDWILCAECMGYLHAERSESARYYQDYVKSGKHSPLPDTGPANFERAALVAIGAFEVVFSRKPRTVQFQGTGKVVSAREFSTLMSEALISRDRNKLAEAGSLQVRCGACGAVMPATECQVTASGMACPRCGDQWFLIT